MKFKVGLGRGKYNLAELMDLKLILSLVVEKGALTNQIFEDSQVFIHWMNGTYHLEIYILRLIYDEIELTCSTLNNFSFAHVFKERNDDANVISKASLLMEERRWYIQEFEASYISCSILLIYVMGIFYCKIFLTPCNLLIRPFPFSYADMKSLFAIPRAKKHIFYIYAP
jgi:hypothetical protein